MRSSFLDMCHNQLRVRPLHSMSGCRVTREIETNVLMNFAVEGVEPIIEGLDFARNGKVGLLRVQRPTVRTKDQGLEIDCWMELVRLTYLSYQNSLSEAMPFSLSLSLNRSIKSLLRLTSVPDQYKVSIQHKDRLTGKHFRQLVGVFETR